MTGSISPYLAQFPDNPGPEQVVGLIEAARAALQYVEDPREASMLVKQSDAIRYLSQKARSAKEVQNQAAEVALRAKRRAGELLRDTIPHEGGRPPTNTDTRSEIRPPTLAELDVHEKESERWQCIAAIPQERFDRFLSEEQAAGHELTTAGAVRLARAIERRDTGHQERRRWLVPEDDREPVIGPFTSQDAAFGFVSDQVGIPCAVRPSMSPVEWLESAPPGGDSPSAPHAVLLTPGSVLELSRALIHHLTEEQIDDLMALLLGRSPRIRSTHLPSADGVPPGASSASHHPPAEAS